MRVMRALSIIIVCIVCAMPTVVTAQPPTTVKDVLARVGDYVVRYEQELSGIVAEEQYVQEDGLSPPPMGITQPPKPRRELKSDLLLVRAAGSDGYVQFRDVFEVDGHPVRDRSERLVKLFLDASAESARQKEQIIIESARYNIGTVQRNINVPLLALMFMHPNNQSHFTFTMSREDRGLPKGLPESGHFAVSVDVLVLSFRETGKPTIVRDPSNKRGEARSSGRIWVETDTGRVLMTELVVDSTSVRSSIQVSYQSEPLLGFLVPVEMRESYSLSPPSRYRIDGTASYGNFRQFTVKTNESIGSRGAVKDSP
jgi:hypothetical protein